MVYIIIGHPFSGKSTFVKKVFLKDNAEYKDKYYICDNTIILGDYRDDGKNRHVGIDRVHYLKGQLFETIKQFAGEGYDVVAEGIQLVRGNTIKSLAENSIDTTLIMIDCSTSTIIERSKSVPFYQDAKKVGAFKEKVEVVFNEYKDKMDGVIINTDETSEDDYSLDLIKGEE